MTEAAELREAEQGDHSRGCEGRSYTCSCGYDARMQTAATRAADHIENLEARVATLSAALEPFGALAEPQRRDRYFLQLLVCPEGDTDPTDWGEKLRRAAREASR